MTVLPGQTSVDIRSLPAPASLGARVVSAEVLASSRVLQLDTALGRVTVTASAQSPSLELGAQLRLQIEPGGTVRLQVPAQSSPAMGQGTAAHTTRATGQLAAGDIVKAQLLPAGTATSAGTGKGGGAPIVVRVMSVGSAPAATAPGPAGQAPTGAPAGTPAQPGAPTTPAPGSAPAAAPAPTAGSATAAGAPSASPSTALSTTGAVPGAGASVPLTGTVTSHAPLGQPVVSTANARMLLATGNLPDGATVRLEVLATHGTAPRTAPVISGLTGALDEAMSVLATTQPALAAAVDSGRVPRFGPKLTSSALFLLSALQGGNVQAMLGRDAQQALREGGHEALLRRISEALSQRAPRIEGDPATGETWRSVYVPVAAGQGWHPLRVAWRNADAQAVDEDREAGSRFQVDFSFSQLGPTRLDGLFGGGRLDLLLVSRQALPEGARAEIEDLFVTTLEIMGLKGHLRFVQKANLAPPEQLAAPEHATVTA